MVRGIREQSRPAIVLCAGQTETGPDRETAYPQQNEPNGRHRPRTDTRGALALVDS